MADQKDCGCGKGSVPHGKPTPTPPGGLASRTQSFTLDLGGGRTQSFEGSLLEAQAELLRRGGVALRLLN